MQTMNTKRILLAAAALLLVPLAASRFVEGWNWGPFDYVFAWVMFAGTGLLFRFVVARHKGQDKDYRLATGVALAAAFMLVWANLAVGFIGDEDNPVNLLFFLVLLLGGASALISRFEPQGMSRAMFATAILQALVPVVALAMGEASLASAPPGVFGVFMLNAFFVFLWLSSALLYKGGKAVDGIGWMFGLGVAAVGLINVFWGNDPEFGIFLILLSAAYLPPSASALNAIAEKTAGFRIPRTAKILLGIFIVWAAVGVGELFEKVGLMLADLQ